MAPTCTKFVYRLYAQNDDVVFYVIMMHHDITSMSMAVKLKSQVLASDNGSFNRGYTVMGKD